MAVKRCRATICGLPEDCLANVFALTTPKDACRFSAVASTFRSAVDSDGVWKRFFPSDYRDIISRSIDGPDSLLRQAQSKKDLYLRLSDHPILIDSGLKWKEMLHAGCVQLRDVCWLEIRGCTNSKMLSFGTNYAAYLVFRFRNKSKRYGFDDLRAEACVGIKELEMDKRSVFLDPDRARRRERLERQHDGAETEDNDEFLKQSASWVDGSRVGRVFCEGRRR